MANIAGFLSVAGLGNPSDVYILISPIEPNYLGYPSGVEIKVPVDSTGGLGNPTFCTIILLSPLEGDVALGHTLNAIPYVLGSYYSTIRSSDYQNYLSRFARFFGVNALQSATHIYINKSDLPQLTPSINNSAESLLVALVMQVMQYESNSLISSVVVEHWKTQFIKSKFDASTTFITLLLNLYVPVRRIEDEIQDIGKDLSPKDFD